MIERPPVFDEVLKLRKRVRELEAKLLVAEGDREEMDDMRAYIESHDSKVDAEVRANWLIKELEQKLSVAETRLAEVTRWMLRQPASEQLDRLQEAIGRDWTR